MNQMDIWINITKFDKIVCRDSVWWYSWKNYNKNCKKMPFRIGMFNVDVNDIPKQVDAIED